MARALPVRLRERFAALPLQARLTLAYAGFTLLPLLLLSGVLYLVSAAALERQAAEVSAQVLSQVAANLDAQVRAMNRVALTALTDPRLQSALRSLAREPAPEAQAHVYDFLHRTMRTHPDLRAVYVVDLQRRTYSLVYGPRARADWRPATEPWLAAARGLGPAEFRVIGPFREANLEYPGEEVFSLIRPIAELHSLAPAGWVRVDARVRSVAASLESTPLRPGDRFVVLSDTGQVVYDSAGDGAAPPGPLPGASGRAVQRVGGQRALVVWRTSPLTGWRVVGITSYRGLTSGARRVGQVTLAATVLAAGLAALAGAGLARTLARPILRLRGLMRRVEEGDLSVRVPDPGSDEFGQLEASFNRKAGRLDELIRQVYEARLLQQHAELRALQAQINPHFLYNTLGAMAATAELEGVPDLAKVAHALSAMFRYAAAGPRAGALAPLRDELDHVRSYMAVLAVRFGGRFRLEVDVPAEFLDFPLPRLSLQPLVENAITHGLAPRPGPGTVTIRARPAGEGIEVTVCDDGLGLDPAGLERLRAQIGGETPEASGSGSAVGLRNVHQRLRLQFGPAYGLEVDAEPGRGFTCRLRVPAGGAGDPAGSGPVGSEEVSPRVPAARGR